MENLQIMMLNTSIRTGQYMRLVENKQTYLEYTENKDDDISKYQRKVKKKQR